MADAKSKVRWEAENVLKIGLKINRNQDPELYELLSKAPSRSGLARDLMNSAIKKNGGIIMVTVKNQYGVEISFDAAVALMDDDIREEVHADIAPCSEQEFFDAYCKAHYDRFGEDFEPAKENPQL